MEHEPDGIVFILPAKKAWNGAAARAACTFRGRDDLSDCACSGERTGGRDDPDGAVAALWNPGSFFFLAALVPQQAVLVPGYCMLLEWCLHKKAASGVWISLAVIGIGCAVEGYVNPFNFKSRDASVLGIGRCGMPNQDMVELVFPVPLSGIT